MIPHKTLKTKASCPWISKNLVQKIRRRDKAYTRSRINGRLEDETKFQTLKREVQKELRRAYWSDVDEIVTPQATDPNSFTSIKRFWKFTKHKSTDFSGVASLKLDGKRINEPKLVVEALNSQFQSVFIPLGMSMMLSS